MSSIHRCLLIVLWMVSAGFAGCLVIPTPEHSLLEGRGKIEEVDTAFLEKETTTREDVLLRFGEPDAVLDRDRIVVYHWSVTHGYWFVAGGYSSAGGPIPKDYLFMLEFDDRGVLKRFERTGSIWTSAQARLNKWTPPSTPKTPGASRETFIIDPAPRAHAKPAGSDMPGMLVSFRMGEFCCRGDDCGSVNLAGHKAAAFGVIVAEVRTSRPLVDMVRSAITVQLETAGHHLVDRDPDVVVTGDIARFGVTTSVGLSSWDAIGSLDITVKIHSLSNPHDLLIRRYELTHVSKTFFGPSKKDFEQVMCACLEDMQKQMAADAELQKLLRGRRR